MRLIFTLVFLIMMIFFVVFSMQNHESEVSVNFGSWVSGTLPVYFVVFIAFGAGVVITSIIGIVEGIRIRMANAKLRHKIKKLEGEVDALRNLPLTGPAAPPEEAGPGPETLNEEEIL